MHQNMAVTVYLSDNKQTRRTFLLWSQSWFVFESSAKKPDSAFYTPRLMARDTKHYPCITLCGQQWFESRHTWYWHPYHFGNTKFLALNLLKSMNFHISVGHLWIYIFGACLSFITKPGTKFTTQNVANLAQVQQSETNRYISKNGSSRRWESQNSDIAQTTLIPIISRTH